MPKFITAFLASHISTQLHISGNVVKVLGIIAGVAFGVFGHDWTTGGEIAVGALATSAATSVTAMKLAPAGVTVDPTAITNIGKP